MYLIEVLLPVTYPNGDPIPKAIFELIEGELTETFGSVTTYARGSTRDLWNDDHRLKADSLVVLEMTVKVLDKDWWKAFRHRTQALFRQEELLIRATITERL